MCGRFTLSSRAQTIANYFGIELPYNLKPRYNIAPSQDILVIRHISDSKPEFCLMRWGLMPAWQNEEDISTKWINARSETIIDKPLFKKLFQQKRCIIVADGFYEWQATTRAKLPFYIFKKDHQPFAIAGLWEHWENHEGKSIESCLLLTTEANPEVKSIHHRMPVILQKAQYSTWLNGENTKVEILKSLLRPYLPQDLTSHEVSTYVNSPKNDNQNCVEKLADSN